MLSRCEHDCTPRWDAKVEVDSEAAEMRIAILATDLREEHRKYELPNPYFHPAIEAFLQGLAGLGQRLLQAPTRPRAALSDDKGLLAELPQ